MKVKTSHQFDSGQPFSEVFELIRTGKLGQNVSVDFFYRYDNKALMYEIEMEVDDGKFLKWAVEDAKGGG